jgi:hypothetical protein
MKRTINSIKKMKWKKIPTCDLMIGHDGNRLLRCKNDAIYIVECSYLLCNGRNFECVIYSCESCLDRLKNDN